MEWISIKDRLPDNSNLVLVAHTGSTTADSWVCCGHHSYISDQWYNQFQEQTDEIWPTHWAELPEPPKP